VKNNKSDREGLKQYAVVFGELLYRHTSLSRPKRLAVHTAWENGWYITIANLSHALDIYIYLDCSISKETRAYRVGFSSGDKMRLAASPDRQS
jgi:hypothetical protein